MTKNNLEKTPEHICTRRSKQERVKVAEKDQGPSLSPKMDISNQEEIGNQHQNPGFWDTHGHSRLPQTLGKNVDTSENTSLVRLSDCTWKQAFKPRGQRTERSGPKNPKKAEKTVPWPGSSTLTCHQ